MLNKPTHAGRAIAAGLLLHTAAASAQTTSWDTVDDIHPGAVANGIVTDSAGRVFVAGSIGTAAVVMKSTDQGTTWDSNPATPDVDEPADSFASASFSDITAAKVSGVEHLVTVGTAGGGKWLVRRSLDAGQAWATLDLFQYSRSVVGGGAGSAAIDSTGRIYVGGSVVETSKGKTVTKTLIRKFQNGTWGTIATTFYPGSLVCSGGNVFAISNTNVSWQVRKSTNGGTTWVLVDEYRFDPSDVTLAMDMAADSQGNIYVVGPGKRHSATLYERFWIVRKGSAGGTQWQNIDEYAPDGPASDPDGDGIYSASNAWPWGVSVGPGDDVFVTGVGIVMEAGQRWTTRHYSGLNGAWTTSDEYLGETGFETGFLDRQGRKIAADSLGNLYATGILRKFGDQRDWIVRRKLAE